MKKILCVVVAVIMALSGVAFAHSVNHHDREEQYAREEAARRNMKLITLEEAQRIAADNIHERDVRFKDADLEDEDDYHRKLGDFRPVWSLEAVSGGQEYDIDIDAVTGEILKFKLDE